MICRVCNAEIPNNVGVCSKCGCDKETMKSFYCQSCGEMVGDEIDYSLISTLRQKRRKIKSSGIINLLPDWQH